MSRRCIGLLVWAICFAWSAAAQDEEQAARILVSGQHFSDARALYRRLLERDPQNVEYHIWIARLSAWLKEYSTATETYDQVLAREPHNTEALVGKAYVQMWQHHFSDAADLLVTAQRFAPDDPDVQVALARLFHYQGRERAASEHVSQALNQDPANSEAKALRGELDLPRPIEVRMGYGQDRFSFTAPGNMGYLSAGYVGEANRLKFQYEQWSLFGQDVGRMGFSYTRKMSKGWWLRAAGIVGPGAVVVPRQEATAGLSHALPHRFTLDGDYRFLRFRSADIHLASATLSYYLAKSAWVTATLDNSWAVWRASPTPGRVDQSFLGQVYRQAGRRVVLHGGYARGTESFEALSIDRLSFFGANTYLAGSDFRLSRAYSAELFCLYQIRSNLTHQTSFGMNFTVRQ